MDVQGGRESFSAILIEREGRFFFYQPGLGVVASGDTIAAAHRKFADARDELLEEARRAQLEIGQPAAAMAPAPMGAAVAVMPSSSIAHELTIFLAKLCMVLVVIGVIGGIAASAIEKQVGQLSANMAASQLSLGTIVQKSEEIVRDVRATPVESKEALRRNIAVIARSLAPFTDAWRNPEAVPEPEGR
jgi:hypothetical protein